MGIQKNQDGLIPLCKYQSKSAASGFLHLRHWGRLARFVKFVTVQSDNKRARELPLIGSSRFAPLRDTKFQTCSRPYEMVLYRLSSAGTPCECIRARGNLAYEASGRSRSSMVKTADAGVYTGMQPGTEPFGGGRIGGASWCATQVAMSRSCQTRYLRHRRMTAQSGTMSENKNNAIQLITRCQCLPSTAFPGKVQVAVPVMRRICIGHATCVNDALLPERRRFRILVASRALSSTSLRAGNSRRSTTAMRRTGPGHRWPTLFEAAWT